jgi:sterol desaturase/sphingolipid hydroxylase (fatty acid hydroxylase superfamily)
MFSQFSDFAQSTGLPLPVLAGIVVTLFLSARYAVMAGGALAFVTLFSGRLASRRIQPVSFTTAQFRREAAWSMLTMVIFGGLAMLMVWATGGTSYAIPTTTLGWLGSIAMIPVALMLHDFYFYWMHRFAHLPRVYPLVHKVHHLSTNPSALSAFAFHPLEALLEALGFMLIIAFVPMTLPTLAGFGFFAFAFNVMGHLGYELLPRRFLASSVGRWFNSATGHNVHHRKFRVNYGLYTLVWDRLFGTIDPKFDQSIAGRD